jgi:flagellin
VATAKTEADGATTILKDATELDKKSKPLNDQAMADNIEATIMSIDKALETIDAARSNLGAKQNRFASTISNLNNMVKNTTAARGQIEDVDFASETAELTKQQTLQQASTAVLAQANQLPAAVLKLLQ